MQARPNRISIHTARVARFSCSRCESTRANRLAFTLVEMLVSVALIAVLMLAVTQIFSIASRTMSGGQAISAAVRDAQAAQSVFARDLAAAASDGPCMIIRSVRQPAFRSAADYATAIDNTNPLKDDTDADGAVNITYPGPGTTYSPLTYNFRNHRLDYLMFFARDRYRRQTGNNSSFVPPGAIAPLVDESSSSEAAIYYHHLLLPYSGTYYALGGAGAVGTSPGVGDPSSNPNNIFGTQWILGRVAMLLSNPPIWNPAANYSTGDLVYYSGNIYKASSNSNGQTPPTVLPFANAYWVEEANVTKTGGPALAPLAFQSVATGGTRLQNARYDLANTSISDFKNVIQNYAPVWVSASTYASNALVTYQGSIFLSLQSGNTAHVPGDASDPGWWAVQTTGWWNDLMTGGANNDQRFQASTLVTGAITGGSSAKQVPIFLPACTQFIVEFAGDFVSQIPSSAIPWNGAPTTYAVGDVVERNGLIYVAIASSTAQLPPNPGTLSNAYWVQRNPGALNTSKANSGYTPDGNIDFVPNTNQIRWYGLPRDTNGDGVILGGTGDVVTLRDAAYGLWTDWRAETQLLGNADPGVAPATLPFAGWPTYTFEKTIPTSSVAAPPLMTSDYYAAGALNANPEYLTAWGPGDTNRPKLIRITLVVDRPEAASNQFDGSSFEYVFKVGP